MKEDSTGKNEAKKLPEFDSVDELVEFVETHDMGEYWEGLPEAHFEVDIQKRTRLISVEPALADRVTSLARQKSVSSDELIDSWLREKLEENAS